MANMKSYVIQFLIIIFAAAETQCGACHQVVKLDWQLSFILTRKWLRLELRIIEWVPNRFGQLQFHILDHLHLSHLAAFGDSWPTAAATACCNVSFNRTSWQSHGSNWKPRLLLVISWFPIPHLPFSHVIAMTCHMCQTITRNCKSPWQKS